MLANMANLRHLKIAVRALECPDPVPAKLQESWLGPLEQLRGADLNTFELLVPESYAMHFHLDERCHFRITPFPDVIRHVCHLGT
jgi:hypothetical protein